MPRASYTPQFLGGYVAAKLEQLRKIVYRLEPREDLTHAELDHVRVDIEEIEEEIRLQSQRITDEKVKPKMLEFEKLIRMARGLLKDNLHLLGPPEKVNKKDDQPMRIQFGEVDEAMLNGKWRETRPRQPGSPRRPVTAKDLDVYASDAEEPMPIEYMSVVKPAKGFRAAMWAPPEEPRRKDAACSRDLREELERRRSSGAKRPEPSRTVSDTKVRVRDDFDRGASRSTYSGRTQHSFGSYVSSKQETFSRPVTGRAYPPMGFKLPRTISRKDPNLIGMSEIYVHPPGKPKICPICPGGKHKMYRCPIMLKSSLLERWFRALRAGVCLNCMIRGHSSFSCYNEGACTPCHQRHNSILCPQNENNK